MMGLAQYFSEREASTAWDRWEASQRERGQADAAARQVSEMFAPAPDSALFYEVECKKDYLQAELNAEFYEGASPSESLIYVEPDYVAFIASKPSHEAGADPLRVYTVEILGTTLGGSCGSLRYLRTNQTASEGLGPKHRGAGRYLWKELENSIYLLGRNNFLAKADDGGHPSRLVRLAGLLGLPLGILGHPGTADEGKPLSMGR
jgi:hypothetical protein